MHLRIRKGIKIMMNLNLKTFINNTISACKIYSSCFIVSKLLNKYILFRNYLSSWKFTHEVCVFISAVLRLSYNINFNIKGQLIIINSLNVTS